ncbi:MAG: hypothetical protein ABI609_16840 [Acidobacteriota bacterium]
MHASPHRPQDRALRERVPHGVLWAAAVVLLGYFAAEASLLSFRLGFPLDDSWIHLQFARNLASGLGLSYNPGELVTGSTAPLWTALLSLLFHLPGNVVVWTKLASAVLFVASVHATFRLGRALGLERDLASVASLLVAGTYWLVWSALSGMEIVLFVWLSLEGILLHLRERRDPQRPCLSLPVLALSALARPEALLLLMLAIADRLTAGDQVDLRRLGRGMVAAALFVVPTLLFYWRVGGSPLPTTFGAKAGEMRGLLPDGQYLFMVFGIFFRPQPWMALLAAAGAAVLLRRWRGDGDRGLLIALWGFGLPFAYALLVPQGKHLLLGNFGRYFFPLFPVVILLGCLGGREVWQRWRGLRPLRALLLVALILPTLYTLVQGAGFFARNVANVEDGDVRMASWLRAHVPVEAVVAVQDIGAIRFFAPQRILDLAGIVSPDIQRAIRAATTPEDRFGQAGMLRYLEEKRPDYLVAFPSWYPQLVRAETGFVPVYTLAVPDNITLAGDQLVVYKTPWTRGGLLP